MYGRQKGKCILPGKDEIKIVFSIYVWNTERDINLTTNNVAQKKS